MKFYKILNKQIYSSGNYSIVPIRFKDKLKIMKWRNDQIYHLRQSKPLSEEDQENYFSNTINSLFNQKQPTQLLFSFLKSNICIGYGGLVNINWNDKNAEISFIMNTELEEKEFDSNWLIFLKLIEDLAFNEIMLKKIYVYAFDLRPHLYRILEVGNYFLDARLKSHCRHQNTFIDVIIYSKIK